MTAILLPLAASSVLNLTLILSLGNRLKSVVSRFDARKVTYLSTAALIIARNYVMTVVIVGSRNYNHTALKLASLVDAGE